MSAKQELRIMDEMPDLWEKMVKEFGHADGFEKLLAGHKRKMKRRKKTPKMKRKSWAKRRKRSGRS